MLKKLFALVMASFVSVAVIAAEVTAPTTQPTKETAVKTAPVAKKVKHNKSPKKTKTQKESVAPVKKADTKTTVTPSVTK